MSSLSICPNLKNHLINIKKYVSVRLKHLYFYILLHIFTNFYFNLEVFSHRITSFEIPVFEARMWGIHTIFKLKSIIEILRMNAVVWIEEMLQSSQKPGLSLAKPGFFEAEDYGWGKSFNPAKDIDIYGHFRTKLDMV